MISFFRLLLLSTSNVRMSEGTFCRVEVHIKVGYNGVYITRTCLFHDVLFAEEQHYSDSPEG